MHARTRSPILGASISYSKHMMSFSNSHNIRNAPKNYFFQVHLTGSPKVGSVSITMSPGSYQHFTIFIVQLLEGNKAMYKPCAEFKGRFQVKGN